MKIREANIEYSSNPKLSPEVMKALDEGITAAEEGRVMPFEEAMKLIKGSLGLNRANK